MAGALPEFMLQMMTFFSALDCTYVADPTACNRDKIILLLREAIVVTSQSNVMTVRIILLFCQWHKSIMYENCTTYDI